MELKADVRVIKKPNKTHYGFIVTFILALLVGGGLYFEDINVYLKEKVDFNKILNPSVAPPTGLVNDNLPSIAVVDYEGEGDTPIEVLMDEASRSLMLGHYDVAASTVERAMRLDPNNANLIYTLADIRLKQGKAELVEALAMKVISLSKADPFLKRRSWLLISQSRRLKGELSRSEEAEIIALKALQEQEKNKLNEIKKERAHEEKKATIQYKKSQEKLQKIQSILSELEEEKIIALKENAAIKRVREDRESNLVEHELLASNKEISKLKAEQIQEKNKLIILKNKRKRLSENAQSEYHLLKNKVANEKKNLASLVNKNKPAHKIIRPKETPNISRQLSKDSYIELYPNGFKKTEFRSISNNKFIKMDWYANGNQHTSKEYLNGKRNGVWMVWDKKGKVLEKSTYDRGELINMLRPL